MPKINYQFSDGHFEEIEVTEEFAQAYEEIDKQTKRNDKKFDWRTRNKESSLEKLHDECGFEIQDLSVSLAEQAERAEINELTPEIVQEFVQKVVVYQAEKINGRRTQRIDIYFNGVGQILLPTQDKRETA